MSISARLAFLERRHGGAQGECRCDGGSPELLYCRKPSEPAPPPRRCPRCTRPVPRVVIEMQTPVPGEMPDDGPAHESFDTIRDFYTGTVRRVPAYEVIPPDGLRAALHSQDPGGIP